MKKIIILMITYNQLNALSITPYKKNYIGFDISNKKYQTHIYNIEYNNKEIEYQISGKIKLYTSLNKKYSLFAAYTQKSFWQILSIGSPFREHNYNPELFYKINKNSYLKNIDIGFGHLSNGEVNETISNDNILKKNPFNVKNVSRFRTRSYNYFFTRLQNKYKFYNVLFGYDFELYKGYREKKSHQNPDIEEKMGNVLLDMSIEYKDILFRYKNNIFVNKFKRKNFEMGLEYKLDSVLSIFVKYFNGNGDSLIDYNNNIKKVLFGFKLW